MGLQIQYEIHPTAIVSEHATLGPGVKVGPNAIIYAGVTIGADTVIGARSIIGEPLALAYSTTEYVNPETVIGAESTIRSNAVIYAGCKIGAWFQTGHNCVIREFSIFGDHCSFGTFANSDGHIQVGDHTRLHNNVFIASYTTIEDYVTMYPFATTLDSPHPPCGLCRRGPTIKSRTVVSAHAVVMPHLTIGEDAVIAAKALITGDVPAGVLVSGVPGKVVGAASEVRCFTGDFEYAYPWDRNFPNRLPWQRGR